MFLAGISADAKIKNSLTEQKLKGRVAMITEKVFVAHDTILRPENRMMSKTISKFDEKGFLTELDCFSDREKLISIDLYRYDTIRGLKIEVCSLYPDSAFKEKTLFKYDDKGNIIEERTYEKEDSLKPAVVNKYDPNAKEEPEFDSDEEKIDIVVTTRLKDFDKQGNWLTELKFEKKIPMSITTREIEYFTKPDDEK